MIWPMKLSRKSRKSLLSSATFSAHKILTFLNRNANNNNNNDHDQMMIFLKYPCSRQCHDGNDKTKTFSNSKVSASILQEGRTVCMLSLGNNLRTVNRFNLQYWTKQLWLWQLTVKPNFSEIQSLIRQTGTSILFPVFEKWQTRLWYFSWWLGCCWWLRGRSATLTDPRDVGWLIMARWNFCSICVYFYI